MKVTITSIELKSPIHFIALSLSAMFIMFQLRKTKVIKKKTTGFWTSHYTMTLWEDEQTLKQFAKSGRHLDAMKKSGGIAKEIRTYTYDAYDLPTWGEAKSLLKQRGRVLTFQ